MAAGGFYWMVSSSVPGKKTALQLPEAPVFFIPLPPDAMMSLGTQFLEVQYNQLLFQLQRTHLGGAQRGVKLLWCPITCSWCLLNVTCSRPSRTFSADTTSRFEGLKKLRVIMTSPNITNKIIKGYVFMVFLFFNYVSLLYLGAGREDHMPGHTCGGRRTGCRSQEWNSGCKTRQKVYLPTGSVAKTSTLNDSVPEEDNKLVICQSSTFMTIRHNISYRYREFWKGLNCYGTFIKWNIKDMMMWKKLQK